VIELVIITRGAKRGAKVALSPGPQHLEGPICIHCSMFIMNSAPGKSIKTVMELYVLMHNV